MVSHRRKRGADTEQGFTLIELLIVIVILGIIAGVVVFAVQNLAGQSATAACQTDVKTVENAAEVYAGQVGHYPNAGDQAAPAPDGAVGRLTAGMDGIDALYAQQTSLTVGGAVGPWLKDAPTNGHYMVHLSSDGKGTVTVTSASGSPITCATVQ
jgi:prepilin-type N-terminal cleavage/methylation domain-containing protein